MNAAPFTSTPSEKSTDPKRLAVFLATSGHSGVDRIMNNLIPAIAARDIRVDLLHVRNHGPYLTDIPAKVRVVELNRDHTYGCFGPLVDYLQTHKPFAMLSDKDRVNRVALLAKRYSGIRTNAVVRNGTTVSKDLASRGMIQTGLHYLSMHYLYRWAAAVLVPSRGAARDLADFAKIPIDRIRVVPSPVVTPDILRQGACPVEHPWLANKEIPLILGVGELCARKDFETLLRAFKLVRDKRACRLIVLGKGRRRASLEGLVAALQLGDHVDLPGFVNNPYAYMARADVYVHSAVLEGSPVALMEALAFGTPVVSTDCPSGPREILQDGRYGKLVPIKDPEAMAAAVLRTLERPPDRQCVRQASQPFHLETSADQYLAAMGFKGI